MLLQSAANKSHCTHTTQHKLYIPLKTTARPKYNTHISTTTPLQPYHSHCAMAKRGASMDFGESKSTKFVRSDVSLDAVSSGGTGAYTQARLVTNYFYFVPLLE